ncbi:MAG: farnesyl diphosphate synthase [Dialister sp.]|nr:farnesyl diphosphate synthase [Dialister sp.]
MTIKQRMTEKRKVIDEYLIPLLKEERSEHALLYKAMNYSLLAGGKRIRPALFLMVLEAMNVLWEKYLPIAAAIECVHTYSLIHDDLPAMDDDAYRRGKLTNHMVFGPGVATMAGDGLLTTAFSLIADCPEITGDMKSSLISLLAKASGPDGMVGGQVHDLESEGREISLAELVILDYAKTGCLFAAPLEMAGVLCRLEDETTKRLHSVGLRIGLLFQITDDILDVKGTLTEIGKEPHHDTQSGKATYVRLMGIDEAERFARKEAEEIQGDLNKLPEAFSFLSELIELILHRNT